MGKTIILNLSGVKLTGDVLDVGESYGVIYNLSKDTIDEVSVDMLEGTIDEKNTYGEYDTCTVFFYLSSIWRDSNKFNLIKEASKLVKVGGEIYIWDINKEIGEVSNNKVMAVLPSGKTKEFEFKNLNPLSKSNIDDTKKMLSNIYDIKEEKVWEDIFFIRAEKIK
ncbi:hypothetical protein [Clostridium sp.]|jgi:hypothetical protein|uniref:hypothetical protein n=2 Tax=Clostridium TaxID=1485 RepID=UPI0025BCFA99|nr:hypothetical protein [Clostridium sp.]MCI9070166.1 hypothetical protein [Clostridium sp.]MCI9304354.1 hypothetical protein [Clostridium sp.]